MPWFDDIASYYKQYCVIHDISKSQAVQLLKTSVLDDHGYI